MGKRFLGVLLFSLVFLCTTLVAQETTGGIEGTVKDPTGAVVPNATVTIVASEKGGVGTTTTGVSTGFRRNVVTDGDGFFRALQIPPGLYTVTVAATAGFGEARYENVTVAIGSNTQLPIALKPGGATASVDVSVTDVPVDTTNSAVQTAISAQEIELIPKGTGFTSLLKTVPGTRPESRTAGFSVDGASGGENVFVIDGQEVTNFRTGTLNENNNIPPQLVQELQVKASGFAAEFGGATGGVISVVTKGGSNDYHGEFGAQFETPKFFGDPRPSQQRFTAGSGAGFTQSVEYFNPPKSGGTNFFPTANMSGKIIEDKLWFYTSYSPQYFETITNTTFYTNAPASTRVQTATDTFRRTRKYEYAFGRLDANPWSKLRLSSTFLWNPIIDKGAVPFGTLSFSGGTTITPTSYFGIPRVDYGGNIGVLTGHEYTDKQGGRQSSNNFTASAVYTATSSLIFTGRFSRGFLNQKLGNYFVPLATQIVCQNGNPASGAAIYPGGCTQGVSSASNAEVTRDASVRTNYEVDGTYIFGGGGRHELKGGYQRFKIFNDVLSFGTTKGRITFRYGTTMASAGAGIPIPTGPICAAGQTTGCILGTGIYRYSGTIGLAENLNQSVYIQDKWQPIDRLTLNLGVRIEKEFLPSFNQYAAPINFSWGDKVAPRLGFSFDPTGSGRTKFWGSWGLFYDRMKFELPRGLFGGDIFTEDFFEILPNQPYTLFTVSNIQGSWVQGASSVCPATGFIASGAFSRCQLDRRVAANEPGASPYANGAVDPNLEPFKQSEITFGFERQVSRNYVFRARYTHKNVEQVIEDAGIRNAQDSEAYIVGNPGQGMHKDLLTSLGYNKIVDPQRVYDGLEIVFERRLSNNWFFHANYTLSRLYGNYSGLVSSDEPHLTGGRTSPMVSRAFDLPFIGFTATGEPDNGRLQTDRPHVFNIYGSYIFDWKGSKTNSTEISAFQNISSGTPQTSSIFFVSSITPYQYMPRGDLGRSPVFSQTDFNVTHRYRFGKENRFTLAIDLNILNLWDQATVTGLYTTKNASNRVISFSSFNPPPVPPPPAPPTNQVFPNNGPLFVNTLTSGALLERIEAFIRGQGINSTSDLQVADHRYGKPFLYQGPREVRFGFRLLF